MRRAIIFAFVLVLLAPIALLAARIAETPHALRFVPSQSAVMVSIPSTEILWHALETHLARADRGRGCDGKPPKSDGELSRALRSIRCDLQEKGISIKDLDAVRTGGIDINRPVVIGLAAVPDGTSDLSFVVAVPVSDETAFRATLKKLDDVKACDQADRDDTAECLAAITDGYALLTNDRKYLQSALDDPLATEAYWRSADAAYEMTRRLAAFSAPNRIGATIIFMRPFLASLAVYGDEDSLELSGIAQLPVVSAQERQFLTVATADRQTADLDERFPLVLRMSDPRLADYFAFGRAFAPETFQRVTEMFSRRSVSYSVLPSALAQAASLSSLTALAVDVDRGVPRTAIVLKMVPDNARELVLKLQRENVVRRQCALANAALVESGKPGLPCAETSRIDPQRRAATRVALAALPSGSFGFGKEAVPIDPTRPPTDVSPATFVGVGYTGCVSGVAVCGENDTYRYIGTPINGNDFHWLAGKIPHDQWAALQRDRYRVVAYYDTAAQRLWLALDLDVLRKALARGAGITSIGHDQAKLFVQFDPAWVSLHGEVSGDNKIQDFVENIATELRDYRRAEIAATPLGVDRGVRIDVRLYH